MIYFLILPHVIKTLTLIIGSIYIYSMFHIDEMLKDKFRFRHVALIYFDSDMSTNTVVYFDWKTAIYIYACGKCRSVF
jgi:hypothetical protein